MADVRLPRSLTPLIPGLPRRATIDGSTVAEVIAGLDRSWPGVRDRLCDAGPQIRDHINVFVDGDRAALDTPVGPASVMHVIPAIAGGMGHTLNVLLDRNK